MWDEYSDDWSKESEVGESEVEEDNAASLWDESEAWKLSDSGSLEVRPSVVLVSCSFFRLMSSR